MESAETKKKSKKVRPRSSRREISEGDKSCPRYPKQISTYIVDISMNDSCDDLTTAQQIVDKQSLYLESSQGSTNSITPTNSNKTLRADDRFDELNQIAQKDYFEFLDRENNCRHSIAQKSYNVLNVDEVNELNPITTKTYSQTDLHSSKNSLHSNSFNYISSDYSDASLLTVGENENLSIDLAEEHVTNTGDVKNSVNENNITEKVKKCDVTQDQEHSIELRQMDEINVCVYEEPLNKKDDKSNCMTVDSNHGGSKVTLETNNREINVEPENIFKVVLNNRGYKKRRISGRKFNRVTTPKKIKGKLQGNKKKLDYRLKKHCENKSKSVDTSFNQINLYSAEVSNILSRTQVLRKIRASDNLLENSELDLFCSQYDDTSSVSTTETILISDSSMKTIIKKCSRSSCDNILNQNEVDRDIEVHADHDKEINHVTSVIKIPHASNIPYKTDVVNIAVAIKTVKSQGKNKTWDSLTSSEAIIMPYSCGVICDEHETRFNEGEITTIAPSVETLINNNSNLEIFSNNFVSARTSSDFTEYSGHSSATFKNNVETVIGAVEVDNVINMKKAFLKNAIDIYPEMLPSTSNNKISYDNSSESPSCSVTSNNVIVTNTPNDINSMNLNNVEINKPKLDNILLKSTKKLAENITNKIINLPNQAEIQAMLKDRDLPQEKCANESRNPQCVPKIWDRLMNNFIELAVHKLEENLVEKIIKELKKTLEERPIPNNIPISEHKIDIDSKINIDIQVEKEKPTCNDQNLQCDLVKSTTIDIIMEKLSSAGPKIVESVALKTLHKTHLYDVEDVKSLDTQIVTEGGDSVTVSELNRTTQREGVESRTVRRLKMLIVGPASFVRENMFIITSVPTFLVLLLCLYGLILMLVKPLW